MIMLLVAYMSLLLMIITRSAIVKKRAVNPKACEAPNWNHALCENGILISMNAREKKAVKVTVAISWYFARRYAGISLWIDDNFSFFLGDIISLLVDELRKMHDSPSHFYKNNIIPIITKILFFDKIKP